MRRLLLAGTWVAALVIAGLFLLPLKSLLDPTGPKLYSPPDLQQFWFAGKLAASGQIARLYDRAAYAPLVAELAAEGEKIGAYPFNRPAFAALLSIPVSRLPYRWALLVAALANVAFAAILVWKLPQWFGLSTWWRPALVAFLPFLWGIGLSQDILLLTLAVALSVRLGLTGREVPAGILLGMCVVKPHLIFLTPLAMLAAGKRRMVASFLATGAALAALSFALIGPAGVRQWIDLLQAPSTDWRPESMANLRALARDVGPEIALAVALLALACFAIVLRRGTFRLQFAAATVLSLLASPHTYHYDLSLLAVVGALSPSPAGRVLLLLPWAHFLGGQTALPWVLACLAYLTAAAAVAPERLKITATSSA